MVSLIPIPKVQFFDDNGNPLSGGKLYTYAAGTTTPLATFTDHTGSTENANPIILNSRGEASVWIGAATYKIVLKSAADATIWTQDHVRDPSFGTGSNAILTEQQTATAGQTVITLTTISYTPGSDWLSIYVNGIRQYGNYTENADNTITLDNALVSGDAVLVVVGTDGGINVPSAAFSQTTTYNAGSVGRTIQQVISAKNYPFLAIGDGIADDTEAIQAAIDYAETIYSYGSNEQGHPAVKLPAGTYLCGPLTINKKIAFIGDGPMCSFIKLKAGATGSLITINAENIAGTSLDDNDHGLIADLSLIGNRTDSVTTGTSHGINCPDTTWSQSTQYSNAFYGDRLRIHGFTGHGIFTGTNRNWLILTNSIIRYCNDSAWASYGYDHRVTNCDFGVCKNYGIRLFSGGAVSVTGSNIYMNTIGLVINTGVNSPCWFSSCSFDYNQQNGASLGGATAVDAYSFASCRFYGNSAAGAGLYSDILAGAVERVQVIGCQFIYANQQVKHLIEHASVSQIFWIGNAYDSSGGATVQPYASGITNDFTPMVLAGDSTFGLSLVGGTGVGGYNGPVKYKQVAKAALPSVTNMRGAMAYCTDEAGGEVPIFCDGTNWRRVTDRAIVS